MPTGDKKVRLTNKMVVGYDELKENLLDYLNNFITATGKRVLPFEGLAEAVSIGIGVADKISLSPATFEAVDGLGHVLIPTATHTAAFNFENAATDYDVGLKWITVPSGVATLPRTGAIIYTSDQEEIGNKADPDFEGLSQAAPGAPLVIIVNSVTESGHSFDGRSCKVWLKTPETAVEANAIETCTIAYSAPDNKITLTGFLGQDSAAPSLVNTDYEVALIGPMLLKAGAPGALDAIAGITYIGYVTGGGAGAPPTAANTSGQYVYGVIDPGEITRLDAHGDVKLRVSADGADVDEPQIDVLDSVGATVWKVDEDGDVTQSGTLQVGGQVGAGGVPDATAPLKAYGRAIVREDVLIGEDLITDATEALTAPRIQGPLWQATNLFEEPTLLFEFTGAQGNVRVYVAYDLRAYANGQGPSFWVSLNAEWDAANWNRDIVGRAWLLKLGAPLVIPAVLTVDSTGGFAVYRHPGDVASWASSAWSLVLGTDWEPIAGTGRLRLGGADPAWDDVIASNALYAKTIPKAFARVAVAGTSNGARTIRDGFGFQTIAVTPTPSTAGCTFTFQGGNQMANANYTVVVTGHDNAAPLFFEAHTLAAGSFKVRAWTAAGAAIDMDTTATEFAVTVFGEQ